MTKTQLVAATFVLATALSPAAFAATDGPAAVETSRDRQVSFDARARTPLPNGPTAPGQALRLASFDSPGLPPPPKHAGRHPGPGGPEGPGGPGFEGRGHRGGPGGPGPGPMGMPPAAKVAVLLSAAEVAIGVRVDQLDAWRAFTSALVAMLEPPGPPPHGAPPKLSDDPFERVERIASDIADRGDRAEAVQSAIDDLRDVLTPEQTERLAAFEARLAPPPPFPPFAGGRRPDLSSPMRDAGPADPGADAPPLLPPSD